MPDLSTVYCTGGAILQGVNQAFSVPLSINQSLSFCAHGTICFLLVYFDFIKLANKHPLHAKLYERIRNTDRIFECRTQKSAGRERTHGSHLDSRDLPTNYGFIEPRSQVHFITLIAKFSTSYNQTL